MRTGWMVLLLCVALSGCAGSGKDEFDGDRKFGTQASEKSFRRDAYTPLPYDSRDNAWETLGKSLVNVPAWTAEVVAVTAWFAAWFCASTGFTPSIR